ncbi:MAG: type IX secretion system protein PorQ [Saprospiraceae bacterium]
MRNNLFLRLVLIIFGIVNIHSLHSQIGTTSTYKFLNLSPSSRISALGETNVSIFDDDICMVNGNPGLLNETMRKNLSLSHKFLYTDISSSNLDYGFLINKWAMPFHFGIQYVDYGDADLADEYGDISGLVDGSEVAINLGTSYNVQDKLNLGVNAKYIYSVLGGYSSSGVALDIGALYHAGDKNLDIGFAIRNIGSQISKYDETYEKLPFNITLGVSKKLEHLPFRFNITATNLERWNVIYDDPNDENNILLLEDDSQSEKSKFGLFSDNLFRHFIFAGEFLLGKGDGPLRLRISYNYRKSKEMAVSPYRSFAGFAFGFGLKLRKIRIDYAYNIQNTIGGKSHITIGANLGEFKKRM